MSKNESEPKLIRSIGADAYKESASALREAGARMVLSIVAAVAIHLAGKMLFLPIAESLDYLFLGYPVAAIVSAIIAFALAVIIFTVFIDIRKFTSAIAGVIAYEFGKASGEVKPESVNHYKIALSGILYVVVISVTFLLFADYLGKIHAAVPAVVLVLIVIWSVFALWRSFRAVSFEIGGYTQKLSDELEKRGAT